MDERRFKKETTSHEPERLTEMRRIARCRCVTAHLRRTTNVCRSASAADGGSFTSPEEAESSILCPLGEVSERERERERGEQTTPYTIMNHSQDDFQLFKPSMSSSSCSVSLKLSDHLELKQTFFL